MRNWYALHVESGKELAVGGALHRIGVDAMVPMELRMERCGGIARKRMHVYVPGYVFVRLEATLEAYYKIRSAPWIFRFLGGGAPEAIPEEQMRMMIALAEHGETMRPAPARMIGGRTVITGGPLQALNPEILHVNARNQRATIEVKLPRHSCRTTVQIQLG
jgi:transcription antitermination factor NusG